MSSTRRDFIKTSLGMSTILSLGSTVPPFLARAAAADDHSGNNDRILVVLQLTGGNDGLNSVVPFDDDEYARNRSTLRLTKNDVHPIDSHLGFHPELSAFSRLLKEGRLSIVQGVGYTGTSTDHDEAMRVWQTASTDPAGQDTGWVGRTIDQAAEKIAPVVPGALVGQIRPPLAIRAARSIVPAIRSPEQTMLRSTTTNDLDIVSHQKILDRTASDRSQNPMLDFARLATRTAYDRSARIESVLSETSVLSTGEYPRFTLANNLRNVAQLIRADLGMRIFYTELGGDGFGGFDNHASQRDNHAALLRQLSESVGAFVDDLATAKLLDRVILMTVSEFGRTIAENGRRGTGHGSAAPVFLAGGGLKGGLIGEHPSLTELENGGPKSHTDFRQLYATLLDQWLGLDSQAVLGKVYKPVDFLTG